MEPMCVTKDAAVVWHDGGIAGIVEPRAYGTGYVNIDVLSFRQPPPHAAIDFKVMFEHISNIYGRRASL